MAAISLGAHLDCFDYEEELMSLEITCYCSMWIVLSPQMEVSGTVDSSTVKNLW
jgi:hypothetical protein